MLNNTDVLGLTSQYKFDKEHPSQWKDWNIAPFKTSYGTYAQAINCKRLDYVLSKYFLDKDGHFRNPYDIQEQMKNEGFSCPFVADGCYQLMFLSPDDPLTSFNTASIEPLMCITLIEAGTATKLHKS